MFLNRTISFLIVTLVSLSASPSTFFTHDGINYKITTIVTSWAESETLLRSQFWWDNPDLALSVASQTGPLLIRDEDQIIFVYNYFFMDGYGWEGSYIGYNNEPNGCCFANPHLEYGQIVMYTPEYSAYMRTYAIATPSK